MHVFEPNQKCLVFDLYLCVWEFILNNHITLLLNLINTQSLICILIRMDGWIFCYGWFEVMSVEFKERKSSASRTNTSSANIMRIHHGINQEKKYQAFEPCTVVLPRYSINYAISQAFIWLKRLKDCKHRDEYCTRLSATFNASWLKKGRQCECAHRREKQQRSKSVIF